MTAENDAAVATEADLAGDEPSEASPNVLEILAEQGAEAPEQPSDD